MPRASVTLTYLGYALVLLLCAAAWGAVLFDHVVYGRVELGLLSRDWLETGLALRRLAEPALTLGLAAGGLGFLPAMLPGAQDGATARAHKAYQRRAGAILLLLLGLVWLSGGRMGAFDADLGAVAAFAWGAWAVAAGAHAWAAGRTVAGPRLWGLALALNGLALAGFAALWIALEIEGMRLF